MLRLLSILFYKICGYKVKGDLPNLKKFVIIGAPHTSNMDFYVAIAARYIKRMNNLSFVAKKELFENPVRNWLLRALGGHPVDRRVKGNYVDKVVAIFNREEEFVLALAPDGTRKKVDKFKTGFYYIALGAKVPIVMFGLNFGEKTFELKEPFWPTGDIEKDMEYIMGYYKSIRGYNPERDFWEGD